MVCYNYVKLLSAFRKISVLCSRGGGSPIEYINVERFSALLSNVYNISNYRENWWSIEHSYNNLILCRKIHRRVTTLQEDTGEKKERVHFCENLRREKRVLLTFTEGDKKIRDCPREFSGAEPETRDRDVTFNDIPRILLTGLRDGWAARRPIGAPGGTSRRRA